MTNGVVYIGSKRGKLVDQGLVASLDCKKCGPSGFHYYTSRIITTMGGGLWPMLPTGIPRGTSHWVICSGCRDIGFDLTSFELRIVEAMRESAKQFEGGALSRDQWQERQAEKLEELSRLRGGLSYALPVKIRERDQSGRTKRGIERWAARHPARPTAASPDRPGAAE
jgi:hypothetical protein